MNKVCTKCKIEKPLTDFYKDMQKKDNRGSLCKACKNKVVKKYQEENPQKVKESRHVHYLNNTEDSKRRTKEWREDNPEKYGAIIREGHLKRRYGISRSDWEEMFTFQKGCCKVCGKHQSELKRTLSVDHCHSTGKVRALLCRQCNAALGFVNEDSFIVLKLMEYIDEYC